jgi:hypothetical protein
MRLCRRVLAVVFSGLVVSAAFGAAKRITLTELTADPGRYLGHELELARGYCVQGGVSGNETGYQCSTDGNVWIAARTVSPASAKKKVDASCGGLDAIERSSFCGARITFTPSSMEKTNRNIDSPNTVLLLYAPEAHLTF